MYCILCGEDQVSAIAVPFLVATQGGATSQSLLAIIWPRQENGFHFSMKSWITNRGLHEQHKKLFLFQIYNFYEFKSFLCWQPCWLSLLQRNISIRRVEAGTSGDGKIVHSEPICRLIQNENEQSLHFPWPIWKGLYSASVSTRICE